MRIDEKTLGFYKVSYTLEDLKSEVEIHETDMGGWILYECFILPDYTLIQIVSDFESLHLIDEDEDDPALLHHIKAIFQLIRSKMLYHPN